MADSSAFYFVLSGFLLVVSLLFFVVLDVWGCLEELLGLRAKRALKMLKSQQRNVNSMDTSEELRVLQQESLLDSELQESVEAVMPAVYTIDTIKTAKQSDGVLTKDTDRLDRTELLDFDDGATGILGVDEDNLSTGLLGNSLGGISKAHSVEVLELNSNVSLGG